MKISVIIVNYNVKYFIEQCLYSVFKSIKKIDAEVWVVDNNSVDGSCALIKEKFPQVKLIENKENLGFSKANNQAIHLSSGEYILLLNPDTVVEEDTLSKVIQFMDNKSDAGGLGVKMIDGKGNFLPESKRALPTPEVSFYKIFGLSKLFPKSKKFSKYHLGYLDNNKIHEIEVLSGAFMLLRKTTIDKIGVLDEDFFMYGEDIDLSYRIIKGGYKNYYFPETTIIHYKGESTKKGSINYVFVFYNAMIIFAKKHFTSKNAKIFSFLINIAIYFRAFLSILKRFIKITYLPILDAFLIFLGFYIAVPQWEKLKFETFSYPSYYLYLVVPLYILIWLISIYYSGGYEKVVKFVNVLKGVIFGSVFILIIYALLNEHYRFSRILILFGTLQTIISTVLLRYIFHFIKFSDYKLASKKKKKIIIIGNIIESERVKQILSQVEINYELVGLVNVQDTKNTNYIGNVTQLKEIVKINRIDEIIFCSKDISSTDIISNMLQLSDLKVDYKIAPPESLSIIGSNSINTAGELYIVDFNSITKEKNIRLKRLFDLFVSVYFLLTFPVQIWFIDDKSNFIKNILNILFGKKSWVGYSDENLITKYNLPKIKTGILSPIDIAQKANYKHEIEVNFNLSYAKNYSLLNDFLIVFKNLKYCGRKKKEQ